VLEDASSTPAVVHLHLLLPPSVRGFPIKLGSVGGKPLPMLEQQIDGVAPTEFGRGRRSIYFYIMHHPLLLKLVLFPVKVSTPHYGCLGNM